MRSAKAQKCVASAQAIMQRRAVVQPNVGQARPWPGRRNIVGIFRIRAVALLGTDHGRSDVPVASLDSQNLRYLALFAIETPRHLGANCTAFRGILPDARVTCRAPVETPAHRGAGGLHDAQADWPTFELIGSEQLRAGPSRQRPCEFPRKVDRVSYAGVHPESPSGDDQMRGIPRDKNATFAVTLRAQQMLRPFIDGQHLEVDRHREGLPKNLRHLSISGRRRMQSPVSGAVLEDNEWEQWFFGDVVMTALAHRNALVQIFAMEKRLPKFPDVAFALQSDAKLLANGARASIAPDQIRCTNRFVCVLRRPDVGGYRTGVLRERGQFTSEAYRHGRQRLNDRPQKGFESVLRDELVWLQGPSVIVRCDLGFRLGHRRIRQTNDRRVGHRCRQKDMHRRTAWQTGIADFFGDP